MAFIALYAITLINVLVAAGFAIAGIAQTRSDAGRARIFALYAAARAVPLVLVVIIAMLSHSGEAVIWLGLLAGIIQLCDAGVGLVRRDAGKTIGPLVIAVLQFGVLYFIVAP